VGGIAGSRSARVSIAAVIVALLAADLLAFRSVANRARPVALQDVIARYRRTTAPAAADRGRPLVTAAPLPDATTVPTVAPPPSTASAALRGTSTTGHAVVAATGPLPLTAPAPGVYIYDTSGHEETNVAGGAHHAYPAQTTITVTASPCGFSMRWDALEQRWDDWTTCVVGRQLVVQTEAMKHAFYGVSDQRTYTCSGTMFRPGPEVAGTPIGGQCTGSGDTGKWSGQVVGRETLMIAGRAVQAVHVAVVEHVSGDTNGTRQSDNWFDEQSGLLLKRVASVVEIGRAHV